MKPAVLVLAGHDPTGGAGVDADRSAIERLEATFCAAVTALTEQDGVDVQAVHPRPSGAWRSEALTHLLRHAPKVVKTGLLPGAEHVRTAREVLERVLRREGTTAVVDSVLAASGGREFLDDGGVEAVLSELVPLGVVLTPNIPEAARLTDNDPERLASEPELRIEAASKLIELGAEAVLLKGGHGSENPLRDLVVVRNSDPVWIERPRVPGPTEHGAALHGSGCRYASTVAAALAHGKTIEEAARMAGVWLGELLANVRTRSR